MVDQLHYYNEVGNRLKEDILNSSDPSIFTSDINVNGPIFRQIKERINHQRNYILEYFSADKPVLDLGCGFGRQSFMCAKLGFKVIGIDFSSVFIDIARSIFLKHGLEGHFICDSIFNFFPNSKFDQVLLLDVFEHVKPIQRKRLLRHIGQNIIDENGKMVTSFPAIDFRRVKDRLIYFIKSVFPLLINPDQEHPYPIPDKRELQSKCKQIFRVYDWRIRSGTTFCLLAKGLKT